MNLLKVHQWHCQPQFFQISRITPLHSIFPGLKFPLKRLTPRFSFNLLLLSPFRPSFKISSLSSAETSFFDNKQQDDNAKPVAEFEDLAQNGVVYQNTLRLVECSMFAAVTGLVYFLSNSLSIEVFFLNFILSIKLNY